MTHQKTSINRRSFLKSSALTGGGLMISFTWLSSFRYPGNTTGPDVPEQWIEINGYIKITPDNSIKILNPNPEFGQNVMTSLPMIVAEELNVDWEKVTVEMGPHDSVKLGPQFTGGSNSTRMYSFNDRDAVQPINYYRLKQLDIDNQFEYSKVIIIKAGSSSAKPFAVLNNPFNSFIDIQFSEIPNGNVKVRLMDMAGRTVQTWEKNNPGMTRIRLNPSGSLQEGTYMLRVWANGNEYIEKVVKQ